MKNLDLDRSWKLCLQMWKWIADNTDGIIAVWKLKQQWLRAHGYSSFNVDDNCFFCEFASQISEEFTATGQFCSACPGCLADPQFSCVNQRYIYTYEPRKFYQKLLRLDKIR